jgi:hypothetical protein
VKIARNDVSILILGLVCLGVLGAAPVANCDMFNLGKFRWIERTASDEKYYLVKDVFLTPGSTYNRKDAFDHNMNETVNLFFMLEMEPNTYVTERSHSRTRSSR